MHVEVIGWCIGVMVTVMVSVSASETYLVITYKAIALFDFFT